MTNPALQEGQRLDETSGSQMLTEYLRRQHA